MTVLGDLYARMKEDPAPVDLDELFAKLGVRKVGGRIEFDDGAPLAAVRAAMTARPGSKEARVRVEARPDAPFRLTDPGSRQ
jgi:hypothetical protein